jgi:hypothetical protein
VTLSVYVWNEGCLEPRGLTEGWVVLDQVYDPRTDGERILHSARAIV